MGRIRVAGFSVSLDGFAAGTDQGLENPLGARGPELFQWFFHTRTFVEQHGQGGGDTDADDTFARRAMDGFGAFILGRNIFGPIRGEWPDEQWKGWWGPNPPYHAPTFVLTHHPRASIEMEGGTTFHYEWGSIPASCSAPSRKPRRHLGNQPENELNLFGRSENLVGTADRKGSRNMPRTSRMRP
jgi:dihydrofolate reductase